MPKFKIRHLTRYIYDDFVRDSANQIMLYPIRDANQEVNSHKITITGNPEIAFYRDYYDNEVGTFTHSQPHKELLIDSALEVITRPFELSTDQGNPEEQWNALSGLQNDFQFIDFLRQEYFASMPEMTEAIKPLSDKGSGPLQLARDLTSFIYDNFKYQKGITTIETTPDEIWKIKSGVCQDFAHILLVMLRSRNIPARYVSGYICPNKPGMRGEGATHAWAEAYIPGMGWIGFDPTNNCIVNEMHVRLAVGKNFTDCSPVKGTYRGTADHTLEVAVTVEYEDGHTSKEQSEVTYAPTETISSHSRNSFRKHQEMQMQR